MLKWFCFGALMSLAFAVQAGAEESAPGGASATGSGSERQVSSSNSASSSSKKKKGKRARGEAKEAEGTEAPNRFEGDPIIKSKYQLNGEPLEVDPD